MTFFRLFDLYTNARTKNNFRKRTCGTFIYLTVDTIVSSIALTSDSINIISQFRLQCCSTTSPSTNKSEASSYRQGCFSWNLSVLYICVLCIYITSLVVATGRYSKIKNDFFVFENFNLKVLKKIRVWNWSSKLLTWVRVYLTPWISRYGMIKFPPPSS